MYASVPCKLFTKKIRKWLKLTKNGPKEDFTNINGFELNNFYTANDNKPENDRFRPKFWRKIRWLFKTMLFEIFLECWDQGSTHRLVRRPLGASWCEIFQVSLVLVRCGPQIPLFLVRLCAWIPGWDNYWPAFAHEVIKGHLNFH